jgi:CBS domain containing-hemolysin-like protein
MDPSIGFIILAFLTLFAGFLTTLEIALASLGRIRLTALLKEHPQRRRMIQALLDRPQRVVAAVALVADLALIAAGVLATLLIFQLFPHWGWLARAALTFSIMAAYLLILGEILPKHLGRGDAEAWVLRTLHLTYGLTRLLMPAVALSQGVARRLRSLLHLSLGEGKPVPVSEDQIKFLLEAAEEHGLLDEEEERMIWRILAYDDLVVRQVMVPRPEVVSLDVNTPISEVREIISREGHSRYPVYEGSRDNILGILHAKDLLRVNDKQVTLRDLIRPPLFTPMIKPINDLLREFQRSKKHMAIVVDEFGSMAGIVTLEDILEEIVGEISDEYDRPKKLIQKLSPREFIVEGETELSLLNEELGLNLPTNGAVTISGLITQRLEEIPRPGRSLTIDGVTLTVESATAREVLKVRLKLPEALSSPQQAMRP